MKLFVFILSFFITFNVHAQNSTPVVNSRDLFYASYTVCTDKNYKPYTGISKSYYEDGKLKSEENYKDGQLDGISKRYYENGKLRFEYNYKDDKRNGISKSYYKNGKLKSEENYKDGELVSIKSYYRNGKEVDYNEK